MLKLKLQYFVHLKWRTDSFEKTLMLGKIEGGRRRDDGGWDGWMASPTQWTWVWVSSGSWWWTGKPGVLQSMGLQRVGHDWATELNWYWISVSPNLMISVFIRRGNLNPETHREECTWWQRQRAGWYTSKSRNAKACQLLPKPEEKHEPNSPSQPSRRNQSGWHLDPRPAGSRTIKRINLCCFKRPNLWSFVKLCCYCLVTKSCPALLWPHGL